jgi:hypothetical protein
MSSIDVKSIQSRYFAKAEEVFPGEFDFHIFYYDLNRALSPDSGNEPFEQFCNMSCTLLRENAKRWAWEIMTQSSLLRKDDIEAYELIEELRERYPNRPWELAGLAGEFNTPEIDLHKDKHLPATDDLKNFIKIIKGGQIR